MNDQLLENLNHTLKLVNDNLQRPWWQTQEFWTAAAVIVALFLPFVIEWYRSRPKKSKLVFEDVKVVPQYTGYIREELVPDTVLDVGRIIVKNEGRYIANLAEAYVDKIIWNGKERVDFIPMPLNWTHGETVRSIYPNQVVYLDVFTRYTAVTTMGSETVRLNVAAGMQYDNLSKIDISGKTQLVVKLYQGSGQVEILMVNLWWDGNSQPVMKLESVKYSHW